MDDSSDSSGIKPDGAPSVDGTTGKRPKLADVARAAGVSTASVSYALNGLPGVSDENRRRVVQVAKQLGFRPNRLARALRNGQTKMLGLLLADIANPFYPEIASAIVTEATARGYEVFLSHAGLHGQLQRDAVSALLDRQSDGLLFTSVVENDRELLTELLDAQVPLVQVVRQIEGLAADFVGIDDRMAGRDIARHVLTTGRRRPAVLGGPAESSASRDRLAGYREAFAEQAVEIVHPDWIEGDLTRESGYTRAVALLGDSKTAPPDALVCANDMIALGAIDALYEVGLRVPGDVAVVGYDDMSFASSRLIGLTSVGVPRTEMGRVAVRVLLQRMHDPAALPQKIVLPHSLVVRQTCGAAPAVPAGRRRRAGS
jgi:LacI family transcriptional regulator